MRPLAFLLLLSTVIFSSCSTNTSKSDDNNEKKGHLKDALAEKKVAKECNYGLVSGSKTDLIWTAFKFTEKVGVKGTFDEVMVAGNKNLSKNVADVLKNANFKISTSTINSKNPDRDAKIVKSFFGSIANSGVISGSIIDATGTNRAGQCTAKVKLNDKEQDVFLKYNVEGESITLTGSLDLKNWDALPGIDALNEVCSLLHKGEDGQSKLWSEIDIEIKSKLQVVCPE